MMPEDCSHENVIEYHAQPADRRCVDCLRIFKRIDPAETHKVVKNIIDSLKPTETCAPCNVEHPKGDPCPKCGRKLLLG